MSFRVEQIDHVELTVPDRHEAAAWYKEVLGLEIISEYEFWADDPHGPLMIGTPQADTKLALFVGSLSGSQRVNGFHLVAFRVNADGFIQFLRRLESLKLHDANGILVTALDTVDHQRAFSIYFCDPWKNQLELTTYDYETANRLLDEIGKSK